MAKKCTTADAFNRIGQTKARLFNSILLPVPALLTLVQKPF